MKKSVISKMLVFAIIAAMSCSEEKKEIEKGSLNFALSIESDLKSTQNEFENEPRSIYISIKDSEQNSVYNLEKLPLIKIGDHYITGEIELTAGNYTVEDFIVVDDNDSAIYLTPKIGSEFATFVNNPLPVDFEVTANNTTLLTLEVIPANFGDPDDYGYVTFSFTIINPLEPGLVAYYSFNSNANDLSGNDNHGVVNGATLTNDRKGNPNSAYEFDGTDDYIEVLNFGNIVPTREISVSIWVKSKVSKGQFQLILCPDHNQAPEQSRFGISIDYKHNNVNHTFWDFGWLGEGGNAPARLYDFTEEFDTNWHNYIFISSIAESLMSIYKNGNLLVEETDPRALINNSDKHLRIGSGDNGFYYNGIIDEVRIYNRVLTNEEIIELSKSE